MFHTQYEWLHICDRPHATGGTVTVSHANSQSPATQPNQIPGAHGGLAGLTMLEPAQYRDIGPGKHQAKTFGIRFGMQWRFYFQSRTYAGYGNGGHPGA